MGFKRLVVPESFSKSEKLTRDLIGIGFVLSGRAHRNANIENTLVAASIEGLAGDYRTLGLVVQWLEVHLSYVNADRLVRVVLESGDVTLRAFWVAVAEWQIGDRRFGRLLKLKTSERFSLSGASSDFQIRRHGEDERFVNTCFKVAANLLRSRIGDVLNPSELVKRHEIYRSRVIMGPSYRADMWALLEANPKLSAAELARHSYGSFATAWGVIRDKRLAA